MSIWWVEGLSFHAVRRFIGRWWKKTLSSAKWGDFVGMCVSELEMNWVCLRFTNGPVCSSVLPLPLHTSLFYSSRLLLTVILTSFNLPFQHAQSKDIFPHLCIVSEVSGCTFFICVILCRSEMGAYLRSLKAHDYELYAQMTRGTESLESLYIQKQTKHGLWWKRNTDGMKHTWTYQYHFYFSGNKFILCPDFVTEKELCRVSWSAKKKKKRQEITWLFSLLLGGEISWRFTGCILQFFLLMLILV